jgi:hypothetical protein
MRQPESRFALELFLVQEVETKRPIWVSIFPCMTTYLNTSSYNSSLIDGEVETVE